MHRHFKRVLVNSWCSVGKQITLFYIFYKFIAEPQFTDNSNLVISRWQDPKVSTVSCCNLELLKETLVDFVMPVQQKVKSETFLRKCLHAKMLPVHVSSSFLQLGLDYLPSNLSDLTIAPFSRWQHLLKTACWKEV